MAAKRKTKSKNSRIQKSNDPVMPEISAEVVNKDEEWGEALDPQEEKVLDWILKGVVIFILGWLGLSILLVIGGYFGMWK